MERAGDSGEGAAECGVTGHFKGDQQRPKFTCSNVAWSEKMKYHQKLTDNQTNEDSLTTGWK